MTPLKACLHTALGCNHQSFACPSYSLVTLLWYAMNAMECYVCDGMGVVCHWFSVMKCDVRMQLNVNYAIECYTYQIYSIHIIYPTTKINSQELAHRVLHTCSITWLMTSLLSILITWGWYDLTRAITTDQPRTETAMDILSGARWPNVKYVWFLYSIWSSSSSSSS